MRSAVPRAQRPVVTSPTTPIATPHAVMIHQPTRLASTKPSRSGPCRAESTADHATATPSAEPTWRLVDAIPAATPACDTGMPDTAVLVIGGFTSPAPMPKTT